MPTERRPWPNWGAEGYYELQQYIEIAGKVAREAEEIARHPHYNVYQTSNILLKFLNLGQHLHRAGVNIQRIEKEDTQQWPKWASSALKTTRESGRYIKGGAKHGLNGFNLDGRGIENWPRVLTGLSTCIEHTHKIETAILVGPPPEVKATSSSLIDTWEMGEQTESRAGLLWRRNTR